MKCRVSIPCPIFFSLSPKLRTFVEGLNRPATSSHRRRSAIHARACLLSVVALLCTPYHSASFPYIISVCVFSRVVQTLSLHYVSSIGFEGSGRSNEQKKYLHPLRYRIWTWHACQRSSLRIRTVRYPPPLQCPVRTLTAPPDLPSSCLFFPFHHRCFLFSNLSARVSLSGNIR